MGTEMRNDQYWALAVREASAMPPTPWEHTLARCLTVPQDGMGFAADLIECAANSKTKRHAWRVFTTIYAYERRTNGGGLRWNKRIARRLRRLARCFRAADPEGFRALLDRTQRTVSLWDACDVIARRHGLSRFPPDDNDDAAAAALGIE